MTACKAGNTARIIEALEGGVSIDDADADGVTALMAAAEAAQPRAVRVLLQQSARLDLVDRDGWSALVRVELIVCIGAHAIHLIEGCSAVLADVWCKSEQCALRHTAGKRQR